MTARPFDCGLAALTHRGETVSGDRHVVASFDTGALVAVIDALGHGRDASRAADLAAGVLARHVSENPIDLVERCHSEMRDSRGAAISLASFDWEQRAMTWLAVGNVMGVLVHPEAQADSRVEPLMLRGGVVGYRLPELHHSLLQVSRGDTLILATDGVCSDFTKMLPGAGEPQPMADRILGDYASRDDDAMVLVFRYNGLS
jgi:negative regulator of sigma-B (phosphoserine phosphatase)